MTEITHTPPHANLRVADQAGQLACFNWVIETYQTQAYNLARRMLSDWALAEDAVQESFVSTYRAFNRLRGEDLLPGCSGSYPTPAATCCTPASPAPPCLSTPFRT